MAPKLKAVSEVVAEPLPEVVSLIENMLADAKAGKIRSFICVYDVAGSDSGHAMALGDEGSGLLIYELDLVKARIVGEIARSLNEKAALE